MMDRVYDFDAERPRLRRIAVAVTAALGDRRRGTKERSDSRIEALVRLDRARIQRKIAEGVLVLEPGLVIVR
mgnify:CR=1 FL=1